MAMPSETAHLRAFRLCFLSCVAAARQNCPTCVLGSVRVRGWDGAGPLPWRSSRRACVLDVGAQAVARELL